MRQLLQNEGTHTTEARDNLMALGSAERRGVALVEWFLARKLGCC